MEATCKAGEISEFQINFKEPFPGRPTLMLTFNSGTENMEYANTAMTTIEVYAEGAKVRVINGGTKDIYPNLEWVAIYQ